MNNSFRRLPILLGVSLAILACGGESPSRRASVDRDRLVVAFDASPTHLDSRVGNDQNSGRMFDLIYSGLVKLNPSGRYDPDIAERWELADEKTLVFHLRADAKFHDGTAVTARDVAFTFESLMEPGFPGPKSAGYSDVDSIETPDERTVIMHLRAPNAGFFDNLTLGILPHGADPDAYRTTPIGAGPYRVVEFLPDEKVELEAFEEFHGGTPPIRYLTIRVIPDATTRVLELRRGSVDFTLNTIPFDNVRQLENDPKLEIVADPGAIYQYLAFNLRHRALRDLRVRRAIAHAIDRERIVRDLLLGFGRVTESLLPPSHWAFAEGLPSFGYDLEKARELLDEAGYPDPDGDDGPAPRLALTYKTSTDVEAGLQAEMIQGMLKEVGIDVTIQSNEFGVFYDDITKGNFELFSLRRAGVVDPDFYTYMFHSTNIPPNGQNRGYYINPKIDELLDRGRVIFDEEERKEVYAEIQRILAEDLPYVSLYHRSNVAIMNRGLENFKMYPSGFLLSLPETRWRRNE